MNDNQNQNAPVLPHSSDGIQEYDNPIPTWLSMIFFGTVAVAGIYLMYYQFGPGASIQSEFDSEIKLAQNTLITTKLQQSQQGPTEESLLALVAKPETKTKGQEIYQRTCASCHGPSGGGNVGPNLTDKHWIHGGSLLEISKSIRDGMPDKGMPPWGPVLKAEEIDFVTAYIHTLQGTKPAGAKPPQGNLVQ